MEKVTPIKCQSIHIFVSKVCGRIKPVKETECTICGKSFMYPSYLNQHLRSHKKRGDNLVPSFLTSFSSTNDIVPSSLRTQLFPSSVHIPVTRPHPVQVQMIK